MKKFFITTIAFACVQYAQAQTDSVKTNSLDDVVVTATKSPKKLSETGKVIKVITAAQIERSGSKDLSQLLNEQAGVTVNGATSNPGKDKSLFLLGATDKYTLILLDGIPLNEPAGVGGSFDLRLLSLNNIERIEILQGSQSTLYGSNAVAGVINIISKKPLHNKPQLNGLVTYGTYNSFKGNANISQKTKFIEYNLNYTYTNTKGISEAKDTTGKANFDKDGYTQNAVQAVVGINVTDKFKLSPYYRYTNFRGGFDDAAFIDTNRNDHYIASLQNTGLNGHYNYATGSLYFNYGYDFTKRDYESQYPFVLSGRFNNAEAYINQNINGNIQMIAGLDYQSYKIKDTNKVNNIASPYINFYLHSNDGLNVEVGGRFNHHNQYGSNFTYSFNPSYLINNSIKIFANVTSGFRAPSINELFGKYGANPNLKPEKSNTQEAGLQTSLIEKKLSLSLIGFNRSIKDVIISNANYVYENLDKQHDYGVEAEVSYNNKKLQLNASYAYINGKLTDKSSGKDSSYYNLIRRPKNAVKLFAGYNISASLYISTSVQFTGKRTDTYFDPVTFASSQVNLTAYTLWNAYAEYRLLKRKLNFFVDVKNIANKTNYYEVYGYSVQGITINTGVHFKL